MALMYNDKSVNENWHSCLTYKIMRENSDCNFLDGFTRKQYDSFRKMFISMVLNTDMATHFSNVEMLTNLFETHGSDISKWPSTAPALELMVHTADISNTMRPTNLAVQWSNRILQEFFEQGDRERALGRPISPLCDRDTVSLPSSQIGFVNYIVKPAFELMNRLVDIVEAIKNLDLYVEYWNDEAAKLKRASEESGGDQPNVSRASSARKSFMLKSKSRSLIVK
jgi:hypothetical protein